MKKILVAYEGSDYSNKAYAAALEIAAPLQAEIFVLSIVELPDLPVDANSETFVESVTNYYKKMFSALRPRAVAAAVTAHFEILIGRPADTIVSFAEVNQIDLIIMGTRTGRSFINKIILGSVAKQVVEYASCSVMVVRRPDKD